MNYWIFFGGLFLMAVTIGAILSSIETFIFIFGLGAFVISLTERKK